MFFYVPSLFYSSTLFRSLRNRMNRICRVYRYICTNKFEYYSYMRTELTKFRHSSGKLCEIHPLVTLTFMPFSMSYAPLASLPDDELELDRFVHTNDVFRVHILLISMISKMIIKSNFFEIVIMERNIRWLYIYKDIPFFEKFKFGRMTRRVWESVTLFIQPLAWLGLFHAAKPRRPPPVS